VLAAAVGPDEGIVRLATFAASIWSSGEYFALA
jgi:hypothetical protein